MERRIRETNKRREKQRVCKAWRISDIEAYAPCHFFILTFKVHSRSRAKIRFRITGTRGRKKKDNKYRLARIFVSLLCMRVCDLEGMLSAWHCLNLSIFSSVWVCVRASGQLCLETCALFCLPTKLPHFSTLLAYIHNETELFFSLSLKSVPTIIFIISTCAPSQLRQCQQDNEAYSTNETVLKLDGGTR
jgi:hypothetical protein